MEDYLTFLFVLNSILFWLSLVVCLLCLLGLWRYRKDELVRAICGGFLFFWLFGLVGSGYGYFVKMTHEVQVETEIVAKIDKPEWHPYTRDRDRYEGYDEFGKRRTSEDEEGYWTTKVWIESRPKPLVVQRKVSWKRGSRIQVIWYVKDGQRRHYNI